MVFYSVLANILPTNFRRFGGKKRRFAYTCLHLANFNPLYPLPSGLFQQLSQQLWVLPYQLLQKVYSGTVDLRWLLVCPHLGEKSAIHLLSDQLTVSIKAMSVGVRDHPGLGVACVTLDSLDIALTQLQL